MARSSGAVSRRRCRAPERSAPASSGARYQIDEHGRVHFDRGGISGYRDAAFFIGSGAAARTFLWSSGGFAIRTTRDLVCLKGLGDVTGV